MVDNGLDSRFSLIFNPAFVSWIVVEFTRIRKFIKQRVRFWEWQSIVHLRRKGQKWGLPVELSSRSCTVVLDSERLDHSEERIFMNDRRSRLARAVLRPDDPQDVARFQASLKVATHVAISILLVVFPFTWTVPRWPSRGFEQRPSFVTVADLQPCLLYLQPSEPTTNPNLMSRFILPFLRRAISWHLAWRRVFLFLPGRSLRLSVYLVYLSSLQLVKRILLLMALEISLHRFRMFLDSPKKLIGNSRAKRHWTKFSDRARHACSFHSDLAATSTNLYRKRFRLVRKLKSVGPKRVEAFFCSFNSLVSRERQIGRKSEYSSSC